MILAQLIVAVLLAKTSLTGGAASLIFLNCGVSGQIHNGNGSDG
jgi:hypothetical protein